MEMDYNVLLLDFYEFNNEVKLPREFVNIGYNFWFNKWLKDDDILVDRSHYSNLVYQMIFGNLNLDECSKVLKTLEKSVPKDPNEIIFVLTPKHGQEQIVLDMMVERKNGIDVLNIDYVLNQIKYFKMYANALNLKLFEIDLLDIDNSFCNVKIEIDKIFNKS
jgi:thymidylate kinase